MPNISTFSKWNRNSVKFFQIFHCKCSLCFWLLLFSSSFEVWTELWVNINNSQNFRYIVRVKYVIYIFINILIMTYIILKENVIVLKETNLP